MLELYHSPISTCSQKVRMVLAEKALDWTPRHIQFNQGDHLSDWYQRLQARPAYAVTYMPGSRDLGPSC